MGVKDLRVLKDFKDFKDIKDPMAMRGGAMHKIKRMPFWISAPHKLTLNYASFERISARNTSK